MGVLGRLQRLSAQREGIAPDERILCSANGRTPDGQKVFLQLTKRTLHIRTDVGDGRSELREVRLVDIQSVAGSPNLSLSFDVISREEMVIHYRGGSLENLYQLPFERWLRDAPPLARAPSHVQRATRLDGWPDVAERVRATGDVHDFLQVRDFEAVVDTLTRRLLDPEGPSYFRPPEDHEDVLREEADGRDDRSVVFVGSPYRLNDDEIAVYWRRAGAPDPR